LNEEKLHNFYLDEQSYNNVLTNKLQLDLDRKRFNYHLDIIEHHMDMEKPGKILDVGAGPGTFIEVARDRCWKPTAIEFNSFCVKRIKSLGIECIDEPLEDVNLKENSFDCVTLWAVFEHLQNPNDILKIINKLLKPGGILAILVPNIDSLAARIMHEKCATFSGDTHINFFNCETLTKIQEMNGFVVKEAETVFSEINTIKNYLNYSDPYNGEGEKDFEFLDPKFIHDNLLGYALVTYSVKS
jgi:2-polyprenyl-3-methyl-5-hydroxy-6-metoxy-1,4-benzoquinol methylase